MKAIKEKVLTRLFQARDGNGLSIGLQYDIMMEEISQVIKKCEDKGGGLQMLKRELGIE